MTYPKELRERVLSKHQSGLGRNAGNAIARELSVSTGWVSKVLHCYEVYGELMPPEKSPEENRKSPSMPNCKFKNGSTTSLT